MYAYMSCIKQNYVIRLICSWESSSLISRDALDTPSDIAFLGGSLVLASDAYECRGGLCSSLITATIFSFSQEGSKQRDDLNIFLPSRSLTPAFWHNNSIRVACPRAFFYDYAIWSMSLTMILPILTGLFFRKIYNVKALLAIKFETLWLVSKVWCM